MRRILIFCVLFVAVFLLGYGVFVQFWRPKKAAILSWMNPAECSSEKDMFWGSSFCPLANILKQNYGYDVQFLEKKGKTDASLFISFMPLNRTTKVLTKKQNQRYIFLMETPQSRGNVSLALSVFDKIFNYALSQTDGDRSLHLMIPYHFSKRKYESPTKDVLIVEALSCKTPDSMRNIVTKWLLENHAEDFKLYGRGWRRILSNLNIKGEVALKERYFDWIDDIQDAYAPAKFVLAFENDSHEGYISEKIFSAMGAGSVPVYWGAPDVKKYIPENCFIDYSQFSSPQEMYDFLKNMPDEVYEAYLNNIQTFIDHFDETPFYQKTFVQRVINGIFPDQKYYLLRVGESWVGLLLKDRRRQIYCFDTDETKCGTIEPYSKRTISAKGFGWGEKRFHQNQWGNFEPVDLKTGVNEK